MAGCGDVLSLEDLQTAKKHQIFEAEVITGKAGGVAGGATIDTATNPVTGQTQQTLPSILADLGFDVQSWTSSTGGVLASANQVFLNDTPGSLGLGDYYAWGGTFPKTVPAGTDPALVGSGYIMRSSRLAGVQAREALRRSYAEAGYNLVDGSFEAGGTLVNVNDVLLQERTGKAFSGPAGTVAAGTNPASGGFVDRSGGLLRHELATSNGATKVGTSDGGSVQDFIDAQSTTVAELASGKFRVGQYVRLTDRAMGLFLLQSGGVANGTDILNAGGLKTAVLQFDDEINVDWLGASGDNSPTDAQYLQRALDLAQSVSAQPTPVYVGNSVMRSMPVVSLSQGKQYNVGATPVIVPQFAVIKGNRAILSCDAGGKIFDSTGAYRWHCEDVTFHGDDVQVVTFNIPNLDNAKYYFRKCWFSTHTRTVGKFACDIKSQSSIVVFDECDGISASNFLKCSSDFLYITGGWYNGWDSLAGSTKPANTAWMENRSRKLWMRNVILIPERDGSGTRANVRWIDNYGGSCYFDTCHFGGENSGFPIVYQYVNSVTDTSPFFNSADITFSGGQASGGANHAGGGGLITLMPGVLPGRFSFNNLVIVNSPLVSAMGYNFADTLKNNNDALRVALYGSTTRTKLRQVGLSIDNVMPSTSYTIIPPCLKTFITTNTLNFGDNKAGNYVEPAKDTPHDFLELAAVIAGVGGQYGSFVADVEFIITGDPLGGGAVLWQKKTYRLKLTKSAGAVPATQIDLIEADLTQPLTDWPDQYLSIALGTNTATNTKWTFTVSSAATLTKWTVSWRVKTLHANNGMNLGTALVYNYDSY